MDEATKHRETLEAVAKGYNELIALQRKQKATIAELLRICVVVFQPTTLEDRAAQLYGPLRGHETYRERTERRVRASQQRKDCLKALADLAAMLEREAVGQSNKLC